MTTLLVDPPALAAADLELGGAAFHHLFRVRRLARGERLRLVDGAGRARWAEVAAVARATARLHLLEPAPSGEPARRVELFVAPPRPERAAWLVEKATEIGVAAIRWLAWERAPRTVGAEQLARLGRVAAAALEQCERSRLPAITGRHELAELPALLVGLPARIVLEPGGGAGFPASADAPLALFVGPEGGFTAAESAALAGLGCAPVALGERLLRVETAALAAAALALLGFR